MSNPYIITFGKTPVEYITRYECIDEIISAFNDDPALSQTYLIRGVRGSGKTVLMTAISKELTKSDDAWVCVDLNSTQNLIDDFSYRLEDAIDNVSNVVDRGFDITIAGFGVGIGEKGYRDSVSRCERILALLAKKGKKVLITIDEVSNSNSMKQFASQFQIWIRKDYPIYLLMTGLYENINAIQNNPQLTFLLRSPKITLGPLGLMQIKKAYENTFEVSLERATELAKYTKGYAFAFQALGRLYWDQKDNPDMDKILDKLDCLLDEYVYQKIWADLSPQDKSIVMQLNDDTPTRTKDIYENLGMSLQSFSKYRERLINKGLIQAAGHGYIEVSLPRFVQVCRLYGE